MESTLTQGLQAATGERRCAWLYRVLDADAPCAPSARSALWRVDQVLLGRAEAPSMVRSTEGELRVLKAGVRDRWMSSHHARLSLVMQRWVLEDLKSKNGVRLNGELVQRAELADGDVIEVGRTFFVYRASQVLPADDAVDLDGGLLAPAAPGLETLSPALAEDFAKLVQLAPSAVTVALMGPTGSGKEVLARAVHALSGRRGPFVAVNCGALPDTLVESELFGHKKGAFSGATEDRPGYVRAANGGTLFLDEVGDLPLDAQPALLRVLQEKQVTPVGSTAPVPVDVRVVSATHHDLAALAKEDAFRDDLRARLTGFELKLPPLLERREDLGLLVRALLAKVAPARAASLHFSLEAARALFAYAWPLNVRELEKALEAAAVLSGTGAIGLEHLPPAVRAAKGRGRAAVPERAAGDDELKARVVAALEKHGGNISAVARELGKARMQIQRWVARFELDPRSFKR